MQRWTVRIKVPLTERKPTYTHTCTSPETFTNVSQCTSRQTYVCISLLACCHRPSMLIPESIRGRSWSMDEQATGRPPSIGDAHGLRI